MPEILTESFCERCGTRFAWDLDDDRYKERMPDCPRCGHNPDRKFWEATFPSLLQMLRSKDRQVSSGAAAELGGRGDVRAVEPLIAALRPREDDPTLAATIALGRLRDDRAVAALIRVMRAGKGPSASAAEALARIGTPESIRAVMENLTRNREARHWLPEIMDAFAEKGVRALSLLTSFLAHEHPDVRRWAATALGGIGERQAVNALLPLLKDADEYVVRHTVNALVKLGWEPTDLRERIHFLMAADDKSKFHALGDAAVPELVKTLLKGADKRSRGNAAKALAELNWRPRNENEKVAFAFSRDEGVSTELGTSWSPPAASEAKRFDVLALIAALGEETLRYGWRIPAVLAYTGDERAVEPLIAVLSASYAPLRSEAAEALGKLGDARAVPPLIAALKDPDARFQAMDALAKLRDERAIAPLVALLANPSPGVRSSAAKALERITGERPYQYLPWLVRYAIGWLRGLFRKRH